MRNRNTDIKELQIPLRLVTSLTACGADSPSTQRRAVSLGCFVAEMRRGCYKYIAGDNAARWQEPDKQVCLLSGNFSESVNSVPASEGGVSPAAHISDHCRAACFFLKCFSCPASDNPDCPWVTDGAITAAVEPFTSPCPMLQDNDVSETFTC